MLHKFLRKLLIDWSGPITLFLAVVAAIGIYVSKDIELKLSLTDLLPQDHPAVIKFNHLTEIVGGVGYVEVLLHAEDKSSHLAVAEKLVAQFKTNPLVRSAFFKREEHYFLSRALYYAKLDQLQDLEKKVEKGVKEAKREIFDIGLWEDEPKASKKEPTVDPELKKFADRWTRLSPELISEDRTYLLVMVKPSFDSLDVGKSKELVRFTEETLKKTVPPEVTYRVSGRYYSKVRDSDIIEKDIFILGLLSNVVMALILLFYFRSFAAVVSIFTPVVLGLGITALITKLVIGHINIITGFLVGILAGVGSDYGIHLLWRIRLEQREPSGPDPDPLWRTLVTCGWANVVTLVTTGLCLFTMCLSSFKVFSEFGFICGVGLSAILIAKMGSFYFTSKLLRLEDSVRNTKYPFSNRQLFELRSTRSFVIGITLVVALIACASRVGFEFDFDKMMEHSEEIRKTDKIIDAVYDRSTVPSAFAASTKEDAIGIEDFLKEKYMPSVVQSLISGATIIPEQQAEKATIIARIEKQIHSLRDKDLEKAAGVSASCIRTWVNAKPFTFADLPVYVQEALRGTAQAGYLLYVYPAEHLNTGPAVNRFATMIKDVESRYPKVVSGSDAGIFSEILGLIERDGIILLSSILVLVGVFIWLNLRSVWQTVLCYLPFLLSLPVMVGLMAIFQVKFNIFNVALLPVFIAVGIEIPIQLMQRATEIRSGFKAAKDIAVSLQLSLLTTAIGFGVMVFTRAGVLKSLGWMSLMATGAIWAIGLFLHPAILERFFQMQEKRSDEAVTK